MTTKETGVIPPSGGALSANQPFPKKRRLRRAEASEYLLIVHGVGRSVKTLEKYASKGGGPAFSKLGRTVLYEIENLDAWVAMNSTKTFRSTSEFPPEMRRKNQPADAAKED